MLLIVKVFPLIEEVLEDIEYDLDESEQMNISDPSKLECTAMILLENGAHIADPEYMQINFVCYKDVLIVCKNYY